MDSRNTQINVTLFTLALAYFIFTFPELPVVLGFFDTHLTPEHSAYVSLCISSWYWWIYASNFLVYVATKQDCRTIYRLFLGNMATRFGAHSLAAKILPLEDRVFVP